MGFFSKFFGQKESTHSSPHNISQHAHKLSPSEDGLEPPTIINRANEISWNAWNKNTDNLIELKNIVISGTTFNNNDGVSRQKILAKMVRWEAVDIIRDSKNAHDKNAIAVYGGMGQIGFINAASAQQMAPMLDAGFTPLAKLSGLFGGNGKLFGCAIDVHLHAPQNAIKMDCKIVGISGKDDNGESRAEIAQELDEGDMIDFDDTYSFSDTITVSGPAGEFGKLGKKDATKVAELLNNSYKYSAYVSDISGYDRPQVFVTAIFWK